jgi:hypothetical protein
MSLLPPSSGRSDDEGSKTSETGKLIPFYTALQPRRQPSSKSPPREPQILTLRLLPHIALTNSSLLWRRAVFSESVFLTSILDKPRASKISRTSNKMTMNDESEGMWERQDMAYFTIVSPNLLGMAKEKTLRIKV